MEAIRVLEKTGKDGALHLRIPLGKADEEYEVVVVVQPKLPGSPEKLARQVQELLTHWGVLKER